MFADISRQENDETPILGKLDSFHSSPHSCSSSLANPTCTAMFLSRRYSPIRAGLRCGLAVRLRHLFPRFAEKPSGRNAHPPTCEQRRLPSPTHPRAIPVRLLDQPGIRHRSDLQTIVDSFARRRPDGRNLLACRGIAPLLGQLRNHLADRGGLPSGRSHLHWSSMRSI